MSRSSSRLKILQWNVWYEARHDKVLEYLLKINADILCLQELTTDSNYNPGINIPQKIAQRLHMESFYKQCRYASLFGVYFYDGNGIFSKYPIVNSSSKILSRDGLEFALERKITRKYLEATITIPSSDKSITVGTTHLSWFLPTKNHSIRRSEETKALHALVSRKTQNFILTGDFNAGPAFKSVKEISSVLRSVESSHSQPTWISKRFSRIGMKRRLDYIFTSSDIVVNKLTILDPGPSDHCPLLLEISV